MNLYKIKFKHYSPKDSEEGELGLLLANSDEDVYHYIKNSNKIFTDWVEYECVVWESNKEMFIYSDNNEECDETEWSSYDEYETETHKEKIIRLRGELNESFDYKLTDLYYGKTLYGWELIKENPTTDFSELIELGIVKNIIE
jgi:hypothetical protein